MASNRSKIIILGVVGVLIGVGFGILQWWAGVREAQRNIVALNSPQQPAGSATIEPTPPMRPPDIPIIFVKGNSVLLVNPATDDRQKLRDFEGGHSFSLSPDKQSVTFLVDVVGSAGGVQAKEIHLYTFLTSEEKILKSFSKVDRLFTGLAVEQWSPDGKYMVVGSGTADARTKTVFEIASGQKMVSFTSTEQGYHWISDNEIIFVDFQKVYPVRPWQDTRGHGIAVIDLSGKKTILQKATKLKDYGDVKVLDTGMVQFSLIEVPSTDQWNQSSYQDFLSYWVMDRYATVVQRIFNPSNIVGQIKDMLPVTFGSATIQGEPERLAQDWYLFYSGAGVYIINLQDKNTLLQID